MSPGAIVMTAQRKHRSGKGFTLIELLIVMGIMAIVAALVFPTFQRQIPRSRMLSAARQTTALLQRARLDAIRYSREARVAINGDRLEVSIATTPAREYAYDVRTTPGVDFRAPAGQTVVDGFGLTDEAIFTPTGAAIERGAFRLGDERGNFLEVVLDPPGTGRLRTRKWDGDSFEEHGQGGVKWIWY